MQHAKRVKLRQMIKTKPSKQQTNKLDSLQSINTADKFPHIPMYISSLNLSAEQRNLVKN